MITIFFNNDDGGPVPTMSRKKDEETKCFRNLFYFYPLISPEVFPAYSQHEFYKWFTDLETAMKSETEEKYQHYLLTLTERIQTCDYILNQVDETLGLFDQLQLQHQAVATKTRTLHDACDLLLIEKQRFIEFADALRSKLNYFDELENIGASFYSPNMSVGSGNFLPVLKRLDECIT